jgi:hypothetical protein
LLTALTLTENGPARPASFGAGTQRILGQAERSFRWPHPRRSQLPARVQGAA